MEKERRNIRQLFIGYAINKQQQQKENTISGGDNPMDYIYNAIFINGKNVVNAFESFERKVNGDGNDDEELEIKYWWGLKENKLNIYTIESDEIQHIVEDIR